MHSVCERVEYLVIEAAKTRGTVFAFREPMWVTWPLARFGESRARWIPTRSLWSVADAASPAAADGIQSLSTPYIQSLALVRSLLDTLLTFPPLPSSSADALSTDAPVNSAKATPAETNKRPSNEEIQAAMSLLAVQPLLPGKASDWGNEGWEEVMAVEVGGWER